MAEDKNSLFRELLRRRRAQESLHAYALSIQIPLAPNAPFEELDEDAFGPARLFMPHHIAVMLDVLQRTVTRPMGRAMLLMPPGCAKSSYGSVVLPTWVMGRIPKSRLITASYATPLAERQSRRAQQICKSPEYASIWDSELTVTREAAGDWALSNESEAIAAGLIAGITGNRATGWIIDDPVKGREDADSEQFQSKTIEAYQNDLLTRCLPGAWGVLIMCMTGDTPVLMADGTEKTLCSIIPGDRIRTYDAGHMRSTTVLRHAAQGVDDVFEIRTAAGIRVCANARHPFLVRGERQCRWVNLGRLSVGDRLVVSRDVLLKLSAKADALNTTTAGTESNLSFKVSGSLATTRKPTERRESSIVTALLRHAMQSWSKLSAAFAQFAANPLERMFGRIGVASSALITTTKLTRLEDYSAMTATSWSATGEPRNTSKQAQPTCDFTTDEIVEIRAAGREEVFDIQVEGTENFIANGIVSHNTRWSENDLAGSILPEDYAGQSGMVLCRDGLYWEVLNIPAKCEHADDPLGRKLGEYLWSEYFPKEHWQMFERGESRVAQRVWSSLYQQRPAPQGSTTLDESKIHYDDIRTFPKRNMLRVAGYSDFAVTENASADWTEHAVFGVDAAGEVWLLDSWSGQVTTDKSIEALLDMAHRNGVRTWFDEKGVIHNSVGPALNKRMRERRVYLDVRSQSSNADKVSKVQGFVALANTGIIHAQNKGQNRVWMEQAITQVKSLPAGRWDDKADVLGLLGRTIDQIMNAPQAPEARKPGIRPFSAAWVEYDETAIKPKLKYRS